MHTVSILGHFDLLKESFDGQTIKTKITYSELCKIYGADQVRIYDTAGGIKFLLRLPSVCIKMLSSSKNIIIMPAQNGVRIIPVFMLIFNVLFRRPIHYVVIGGWLSDFLRNRHIIRNTLKRINKIYVETQSMADAMKDLAFKNVLVMPNCKHLPIVTEKDLPTFSEFPYPLCTFSRVCKAKGIEDAINAVKECNRKLGKIAFTLDIYGKIEGEQWFEKLMKDQPKEIKYCGTVPFDKSVDVLKNYYALLFPTYYEGEGFAGTILDAFSSGLPVVASDWHSNKEIVEEGVTGFLFPPKDTKKLTDILIKISSRTTFMSIIRKNCIRKAQEYKPSNIVKILTSQI